MQQTKLQGVSIGLSGNELKLGDKAPELSLVAADLSEVKVGGGTGKAQVIIAVPPPGYGRVRDRDAQI